MPQTVNESSPSSPSGPAGPDGEPSNPFRRELARAYAGMRRATAALIHRYEPFLHPSQVDARVDEVLQEAAARVLQREAEYDGSQEVAGWLMGFVKTVCREQSGRKARQAARTQGRTVGQADLSEEGWRRIERKLIDRTLPRPGAAAEKDDDALRLARAMASLSGDQRTAIQLWFYEDLDGHEVARRLGAPSSGAVRVRVHRAVAELRKQLAATCREEVDG